MRKHSRKKSKNHIDAVARCKKQMKEQQKQNTISTNVRKKPSSIPEPPCCCQVSRRQTKEGTQKDGLMSTDVNNISSSIPEAPSHQRRKLVLRATLISPACKN
jgi:hypothetical protein